MTEPAPHPLIQAKAPLHAQIMARRRQLRELAMRLRPPRNYRAGHRAVHQLTGHHAKESAHEAT